VNTALLRIFFLRNLSYSQAWSGDTGRTASGSIPGGVTGFFSDIFPSDRTMALGVDSDPSENQYKEHFLEVKAAGA